jgi:hypothetical protein
MIGTLKQLVNRRRARSERYLVCHPQTGGKGCVAVMLEPVEAYVAEDLWSTLESQPGWTSALAADQYAVRRAELGADLERIAADRVDLARQRARREIEADEWSAMREEYNTEEAEKQQELRDIPQPIATPGGVDWTIMRELWNEPDAELDERRAFLRRYIRVVTVHRARRGAKAFESSRVTITYHEV